MREYLEVLTPLLRGEPASFQGDEYKVNLGLQVPGAGQVPLLVAALGPVMLGLAGRFADGTITWMTGPKTIESHVGPVLRKAASDAGRPDPRIVAGLPIAVTDDAAAAREKIGQMLAMYGTLPSYRAMLDREGLGGPGDIAIVGNEQEVGVALDGIAAAGATELIAAVTPVEDGTHERTLALLESRI
jgi:F420-dependent oxidoreductase-like protein